MIPVGPGTLGRIMNVTGDPIDERGPIKATKFAPIHAEAPAFVEQSTAAEILVTGIKGMFGFFMSNTGAVCFGHGD